MKIAGFILASVGLLIVVGCANDEATAPAAGTSAASAGDSTYLLTAEPEGAKDVIQVRKSAADGDDVLIVGRIGGGENPWIKGRAAFSIVDGSVRACSDIPGDTCKTPWDYCCETHKLPDATALVKVVDASGNLVKTDAQELLKVKELSRVVVKGKAQRDDDGNLTILASGVYVKE